MDGTNGAPQGAPQGVPQGFGGGPPPGGRPPGAGGAMMFLGPWGGIAAVALLVATYVVLAVSFWQFLKKAGLTPMVALLMLVPVVNLGVALWVAFTEWPVAREIDRLKLVLASAESIGGRPSAEPQGSQPMPGTTTTG